LKCNPDLKRIKESYENEIIDLRAEVRRLKDELDSNEKNFRNQKEKFAFFLYKCKINRFNDRISLLEKENQKLFLDIERANFVKSIDSGSQETKNEGNKGNK